MVKIKNARQNNIKGVFFDYGGVIEDMTPNKETFHKGVKAIGTILYKNGITLNESKVNTLLRSGQDKYNKWFKKNNSKELPNEKIWTVYFLKEYCKDKKVKNIIENRAEELSSIYEYYLYKRRPRHALTSVIKTLFYSGYTISLISNTMSSNLIPDRLERFEILKFFNSIVLSINTGYRKPRKEIFNIAFKETHLKPEQCLYIGDTISRDVEGSTKAGFFKSVLIKSGLTELKDSNYSGNARPDYSIERLIDLCDVLQ